MSQEHKSIASRQLHYTRIGESDRRLVTILINAPYLLTDENADIAFDEGTARCLFSFDGLDERGMQVTGADTLQAVELAINAVEPTLRRLSKKYEFYFLTGEPYFDN